MRLTRPSPRGLAAIAVLLAWGGSLGWLAGRQLGQSEASTLTATAALRLSPGDAWFAVMAGETQVGVVGVTLDTLSPGYRILETLSLELPRAGRLARTNRTTEITLAPSLAVTAIASRSTSPGRRQTIELSAVGSRFTQTIITEDDTVTGLLAEGEPPVPLLAAPYRLAFTGALGAGQGRNLPMVAGWPLAVRVGAATPEAEPGEAIYADSSVLEAGQRWVPVAFDTVETRTVVLDAPTGAIRLTVDTRGVLVALAHPLGVTWRRTDFSIALQAFRSRLDTAGPAVQAALPTLRPLVTAPTRADADSGESRFEVTHRDGSPLEPWAMATLHGGRQRSQSSGILRVGARGGAGSRRAGPDVLDPFIQHDAPAVVALAADLGAEIAERDWEAVARALQRRVRVDTAATAAEDALGALQRAVARPDGMARLFVAVIRAAGGQARYVVGVAPRGDVLYTHAWAEVRDRGRDDWESVDPARGQGTAETDLIRVGLGGSSHPDDLLTYVADVRFTPTPAANENEEAP